ncbi:MAG: class I SAM-dependent methyltransferase [Capsulimonadales bacterium]|nr:class I SAM-dependent methyltransferase [Capsulimonadales bacterium]
MNRDEYDQMFRLEDEHWWFAARRNLILRAVRSIPAEPVLPRRFLDVGCGTGGTLARLAPSGEVVGLDMEPLALTYCRRRGLRNLVQGSATSLPFRDAVFSGVLALDVLEHLPEDSACVREIARVLAPGGVVYVTVPAYRSLWSSHDVALMHQRRYVAGEVRRLLEGEGLEIVRLSYTVSLFFPPVWLIRTLRRRLRPGKPAKADVALTPPWLNGVLRRVLDIESRIALRFRLPFGVTVFAAARKPVRTPPAK